MLLWISKETFKLYFQVLNLWKDWYLNENESSQLIEILLVWVKICSWNKQFPGYFKIFIIFQKNTVSEMQTEEQPGFKIGRCTIDYLFTVTQVIENRSKVSWPKESLWQCSSQKTVGCYGKNNMSVEVMKAVKVLYKHATAKIKIDTELTTDFKGTRCVKQECCNSPTLFKIS